MLELSCKSIVNKMVENKIIDAEKFEIYVYNLYTELYGGW